MSSRGLTPLYCVLALLIGAQVLFSTLHPRDWREQWSPGALPPVEVLRVLSAGENYAVASALTLRLQTFDAQAGKALSIRKLDMDHVINWLAKISTLAPDFSYPLFLASRIYASTAHTKDTENLLDWVETRYPNAPAEHWPWLAYGVHLAKHKLEDRRLARHYAGTLRTYGQFLDVPQWALDLEVFLLKDLNELEAAQLLLGQLIASGSVDTDPRALAVMVADLEEIEAKIKSGQQGPQEQHPIMLPRAN
jgi:hypothetical protein